MIDRRKFMAATAGSIVFTTFGQSLASASTDEVTAADLIKEFTGGASTSDNKITLDTPEIAENGNNVPILIEVDSEMTGDDMVESVLIVADGNPLPEVVRFNFSPLSGEATAKTRIRLAQTQNVTAIAKMSDGTFQMASNSVKVTIGGCGG